MMARMPELSLSETSARREAEQRVDFLLGQDALGAALGGLHEMAVLGHAGPLRRHRLGAVGVGGNDIVAGRRRRCGFLLGFKRHAPFGGESVLVDLVVRHRLGLHFVIPGPSGARSPESITTAVISSAPTVVMDSGLAAAQRSGMTR